MLRNRLIIPLMCLVLALAACQSLENTARDSVAAAKGFIEQAQRNHSVECQANPNTSICSSITKAVNAQNLAIDVINVYCASTGWQQGASCKPNKDIEPRVREVIKNLDRIIKDAKGVIGQ